MKNPFRRSFFEAAPPQAVEPPEVVVNPQPRVDEEPVMVTPNMRDLARQIGMSPVWADIVKKLRRDLIQSMCATTLEQHAHREDCYRQLKALDDINGQLMALSAPELSPPARLTGKR